MMRKSGRWMWIVLWGCLTAGLMLQIRDVFYSAFSSGNLSQIDKAIEVVRKGKEAGNRAFEGALMMKKADLIKGPGEKLKVFKAGHAMFEKEIAADPENVELRFIRLCVQEHAPKIVKYHKELKEDKAFVIKNFAKLPEGTKKHVRDYAKSSKELTEAELK